MLELRGHGTLKATGNKTLHGIAAVFNSEANLGTFSEVIRPGAFAKSLATGSNIRALYHHDGSALLGTTRGGTLQLRETPQGLAFELALPDTTHGRDLAILVDAMPGSGSATATAVAVIVPTLVTVNEYSSVAPATQFVGALTDFVREIAGA